MKQLFQKKARAGSIEMPNDKTKQLSRDFDSATSEKRHRLVSANMFGLNAINKIEAGEMKYVQLKDGKSAANVLRWMSKNGESISLIEKRLVVPVGKRKLGPAPREALFSFLKDKIEFTSNFHMPEIHCISETKLGWSILMDDVLALGGRPMQPEEYLDKKSIHRVLEAALALTTSSTAVLEMFKNSFLISSNQIPFSFRGARDNSDILSEDLDVVIISDLENRLMELMNDMMVEGQLAISHLDINERNIFFVGRKPYLIDFGQVSLAPIGLDQGKILGDVLWKHYHKHKKSSVKGAGALHSDIYLSGVEFCISKICDHMPEVKKEKIIDIIVVSSLLRLRKRWLIYTESRSGPHILEEALLLSQKIQEFYGSVYKNLQS